MKFIHIADIHLGASPDAGRAYSKDRPAEIWESFEKVIGICQREQTDLLLIAGDLFHRQPLKKELKEVNYYFSLLSHTKVVFIAGNHDYVKPESYYRSFRWNENVFPLLGNSVEKVVFDDLDTAVYGFSYDRKMITDERYSNIKAEGTKSCEILLAHGGDEKHIPIRKESLQRLGFDYIAMGHIHKPQIVVPGIAAYAGALEPIDKNDTGKHGFIKGEITEKGVKLSFVPYASREYVHLVLNVEESMTNAEIRRRIEAAVKERGRENLYKFILRGFRAPDLEIDGEHMDQLGNILEIADETVLAYDFERLRAENSENLIGKYIELFEGCERGSVEYDALCAGVQAMMENRKR